MLTEKYGRLKKVVFVLSFACLAFTLHLISINIVRPPAFPLCSSDEQAAPEQALLMNLKKYYKEKGVKSIVDLGSEQCSLLSVLVNDFEVMGVNPTTNSNAPFMYKAEVGRPMNLFRKFDYAQSLHVGIHIPP